MVENVDSELDRLLVKLASAKKSSLESIEGNLETLAALKSELLTQAQLAGSNTVSASAQILMKQSTKRCKETAARISQEHKEIHPSVSRLGKSIDKNFIQDFNLINSPEAFEGLEKQKRLNRVILEHLFRNGLLDVGQKLAEEAHLEVGANEAQPFFEIHEILSCLDVHDTGPALSWAARHREELARRSSSLEYKLHRLRFIHLLRKSDDIQSILDYTKNFQYFLDKEHQKDVQRLMGSLLFLKYGLEQSPYRDLLSEDLWADVRETFTKDACALLGLSRESPLSVCIRMGCKAIPMLLTIRTAMMAQQVGEMWNCSKSELPIEIDISPQYLFHSKFTCPILRQQASEKNPPCRLNCGHVISRDALNRLSVSQKSSKIKCPYCPSEQQAAEAKTLFL